ncbi:MAG TPA: GNAT family N-acetyltransferase [Gaiellaceae bacterium]|nr:GNAT family N-acetyltransferase [Gaiellaceae bacterium]
MVVPLEIGRPQRRDIPQLYALAESAFAGMPGWNPIRVVRALEEDVLFVARELGALAGYLALRRENERSLLIEQVLVAPGHERRGVGRRLLAYAEGYAVRERVPALRVVVETTNYPARDLYRRLGFVAREPEIFERSLPYVI